MIIMGIQPMTTPLPEDIITIERSLKKRGIGVLKGNAWAAVAAGSGHGIHWLSRDGDGGLVWTDMSDPRPEHEFPTREAAMRAAHATPLPWEVSPNSGKTSSKLGDELCQRLADLCADLAWSYTERQRDLLARINECERLLESIAELTKEAQ